MNRLLPGVGMPQSAAAWGVSSIGRGRRVVLGPEFHRDLEFWRWFAIEGFEAIGGCLSAPIYKLVSLVPRDAQIFQMHLNRPWGVFAWKRVCVLAT